MELFAQRIYKQKVDLIERLEFEDQRIRKYYREFYE
jgi:hypothetical protein